MPRQVVLLTGLGLCLAAALLFLCGHRLRRGHWLLSLLLLGGLTSLAWLIQVALSGAAPPLGPVLAVALLVGGGITAACEDWNPCGHAAFTAVSLAAAGFLIYAVFVVVAAHLGPWSLVFATFLLLLQAGALLLLVAHTFEILDVVCRVRWRRVAGPHVVTGYNPKVSIHVPTHNEPPELVIQTLDALAALDYPSYEVLVIDNNTADEALWRPVEAHCARLGPRFRFFHLLPWPGYKSGALNFALSQTAVDAEIVGIVDADYLVQPNFLADLVGHFADPQVAYVQTPQDYRDADQRGRYGRALYLAYLYFFKVSMATRNEHNAIIFAGTMGLIRKRVLVAAGGWDEWCITEDAEVSLRLLDEGYTSVYIDRTYGRGLMPLDLAGLKKQRFRWAFGGMQLLRLHWRRLLNPWSGGKLTAAQRAAYLSGGLQWLNDPLALGFTLILLIGSGSLLAGGSFYLQPLVGAALYVPVLFIFFAVVRFLWAFRVRTRCSWREATDALTVLLGLTWIVTLACLRGLVSRAGVFLRTPKQGGEPSLADTLRLVRWELLLGATCLGMAGLLAAREPFDPLSARGVASALLLWQAAIYLSAVRTGAWSYLAGREPVPAFLRRTFRTTGHAWGILVPERRLAIGLALAAAVMVALFWVAVTRAPLAERLMRADPLDEFLAAESVLPASPAERAGAVLVREAAAARRGDPQAALILWDPSGVIVDANYTPAATEDDQIWQGPQGLRARYRREFQERRYQSLRHLNLRIEVEGERAVIVNDLRAVMESGGAVERVSLPRSDRWELRRDGGMWRIVRLEVNRAPRPLGTGAAEAGKASGRS